MIGGEVKDSQLKLKINGVNTINGENERLTEKIKDQQRK